MTIPRTDVLKPRPRLGTPSRSQQQTKLVELTTDAHLLQTVPISPTLPTNGQVPMYDALTGQYRPSNVAAAVAATVVEAPVGVFSAQELAYGASYVRFVGSTDPENGGNLILGPGGFQRVEVLKNTRDGGAIEYSPTVVDLAGAITTTTQDLCAITVAGPANGQYIRIDSEAMLVISGGGTTTIGIARGRLQTTATTHSAGTSVLRVNVESVMHVTGGLRATGGVATSDLSLQGYSTHELEIRATFTEPIPSIADGQTEFGYMMLHRGSHSHTTDVDYAVEIDTQGGVGYATFQWSDDGGASWIASLVPIPDASAFISLQNGVTISFSQGSYFVGNRWDFTAIGVPDQKQLLRVDTVNSLVTIGAVGGGSVFINDTLIVQAALDVSGATVLDSTVSVTGLLSVTSGIRIDTSTAANQVIENQAGTDILKFPHATSELRILVPTLIGADASPAAGVALELRGGRLRMAATANDYIEDSAGNRHLTFASSATAVAVTSTFAGDLRVNDQLGVGGAVVTNVRAAVLTWANLGNATSTMLQVFLSGVQSATVTGVGSKRGFAFSGAWDLGSFNLPNFIGIDASPTLDDSSGGGVCTNFIAVNGQIRDGGTGAVVTQAAAFRAAAPNLTGLGGVITDHAGQLIENQGHANIATSVGVDIKDQSGSTVESIGLRLNANFMEGTEMAAPAAPAANNYRIFGQDNGAGKTQLMVEFSSGGAMQLAIEP